MREVGTKARIKLPDHVKNSDSSICILLRKKFANKIGKIVTIKKVLETVSDDYAVYSFEEGGTLSDIWLEDI